MRHYRIEPDDPDGPILVRDAAIDDVFVFSLFNFASSSTYSAVLSFPGFLPFACASNITSANVYAHHRSPRGRGRRLLDTHSARIDTGNRAIEQTIIKIEVRCRPIDADAFDEMMESRAALSFHRKTGEVDLRRHIVQFAIKVDSLWLGLIPNSLCRLAIAALIVLIVVVFAVTPCVLTKIKSVKDE